MVVVILLEANVLWRGGLQLAAAINWKHTTLAAVCVVYEAENLSTGLRLMH